LAGLLCDALWQRHHDFPRPADRRLIPAWVGYRQASRQGHVWYARSAPRRRWPRILGAIASFRATRNRTLPGSARERPRRRSRCRRRAPVY